MQAGRGLDRWRAHSSGYSSGYSYGYSYSSGEWAAGVYYYHTESWQGSACSSACYAVASSSRHRRRTSPAAIDGRLRGEKRWGGVKEAVARRLHMFTCQTGTDGTGGGLQSMARVRGLPGSTCRHRNRTPDLQMPDTHTVVVVLKVPIISTVRNNTLACHSPPSRAGCTTSPHRLGRCWKQPPRPSVLLFARSAYCLQRSCSIEYLLRQPSL